MGERRKAALAVMTLLYSDAYFLSAYPASAPRPSTRAIRQRSPSTGRAASHEL